MSLETNKAGGSETKYKLRRGQRFTLEAGRHKAAVRLESGCLLVAALLPARRRQVIAVLYPGDTVTGEALPAMPGVVVAAASATLVSRPSKSSMAGALPFRPSADADDLLVTSRLMPRMALHALSLGRLDGAERLATLLIELALVLGRPTPGGFTVDNPLSRTDMADYLALNPDTLSRQLSRLKGSGVIAAISRSRVIIRNFEALCAISPLAGALKDLYRS